MLGETVPPLLFRCSSSSTIQLNNQMLAHLRRQGLIEAQDVSNLDTATGERDLLFTFFTEAGRKLLEN